MHLPHGIPAQLVAQWLVKSKATSNLACKQQPLLAISTLLEITDFDQIKSLTNNFIMQALIANGTIS